MVDYRQYAKMSDANFKNPDIGSSSSKKDEIPWEDEFLHAIYIGGKTRVEEKAGGKKLYAGALHIRGVDYNMDEIHIIPYYKRQLLSNTVKNRNFDSLKCFSYAERDDEGNQISTCGFYCPPNSYERKSATWDVIDHVTGEVLEKRSWCNTCKTIIVIAGFLCNKDGEYTLDENKKPINVFLRVNGSKVGDVMSYIFECKNLEVPYLFDEDPTEESMNIEKITFNIFRRIITIKAVTKDVYYDPDKKYDNTMNKNRYGYELCGGKELSKEMIFKLLDYALKIDDDLKAKFDYSELATKTALKYHKKALDEFRATNLFKTTVPGFIPNDIEVTSVSDSNATPPAQDEFMTVDSKPSVENKNNEEAPPSNVLDINDIPF